MPQAAALIDTLKSCLKAERKTYADVAATLGLSEASVKRLFSERDFTLERLDAVCRMLGIEIADLVRKMQESSQRLDGLSVEQEREITGDPKLLIVTLCALHRWTVPQIVDFYAIEEAECIRRLARLDQLGLIDLMPGNRIKLRVSPNFRWRENGPIQQFFRETVGKEFFQADFLKEGERLLVLNGMLSPRSNAEFQRKLQRLAREFNELNDHDAALPFEERSGVTFVMAMRNWEYGLFGPLRRSGRR